MHPLRLKYATATVSGSQSINDAQAAAFERVYRILEDQYGWDQSPMEGTFLTVKGDRIFAGGNPRQGIISLLTSEGDFIPGTLHMLGVAHPDRMEATAQEVAAKLNKAARSGIAQVAQPKRMSVAESTQELERLLVRTGDWGKDAHGVFFKGRSAPGALFPQGAEQKLYLGTSASMRDEVRWYIADGWGEPLVGVAADLSKPLPPQVQAFNKKVEQWQSRRMASASSAPAPQVQVGDIFVSSWGYDQTNVDFYELVALSVSGTMGTFREINKRVVGGRGEPSEKVLPVPGSYTGSPFRKKLQPSTYSSAGVVKIKLNEYSFARPWDGKPKDQTGSSAGH